MKAFEFVKKYGWVEAGKFIKFDSDVEIVYTSSFFDDLKKLVESWELVESYGGLKEAIRFSKQPYRQVSTPETHKKLCQAIADMECCQ